MTADVVAIKELSARGTLKQWIREQIGEQEEIVLPALTDAAVEYVRESPELASELLKDVLRPLVYSEARAVLQSTRTSKVWEMGDSLMTDEARTKKVANLVVGWPKWLEGRIEQCGDRLHKRMLNMTRPELTASAEYNFGRGRQEFTMGYIKQLLAAQMDSDEPVTLEDTFKHRMADLEAIRAQAAEKVGKL